MKLTLPETAVAIGQDLPKDSPNGGVEPLTKTGKTPHQSSQPWHSGQEQSAHKSAQQAWQLSLHCSRDSALQHVHAGSSLWQHPGSSLAQQPFSLLQP
eukprot:m.107262 g.107262  ORF g.107262 m.107262 type:complete len:98 (+) comp15841_c0_seq2:69-362(+)